MKNIIEVKNLVKTFKGGVRAVDDVSFSVQQGQFFGFLGPNGAGKTTTMRVLATLSQPTSGKVKVNGYDVVKEPDAVRKSIGFAMQSVGLDDLATAWENLILIGNLYGLTVLQAKDRARELLEMFHLEKAADRYVQHYSGGMRRRLDVATALMHNPKILFLDEPTEGLDPSGRRVIWKYLQDLNKGGTTIFLTTHYMEEADYLTRDLAIINHGKIVVRDTPKELKRKIGCSFINLELSDKDRKKAFDLICEKFKKLNCRLVPGGLEIEIAEEDNLLPAIISALDKVKVEIVNFNLHSPSLEDVFLKYAGERFEGEEAGKGIDPYVRMRQRPRH
ncbi:MAG: ATP-binding cassette domain-containing protein [Candidatus Berkelbacteria bacterium]|nr:ATP-binding cassette domain-containing protein [Candidatus Berkelbacteria bacterium]